MFNAQSPRFNNLWTNAILSLRERIKVRVASLRLQTVRDVST